MITETLIKELNKGILFWYPFEINAKILLVEHEQTPLRELFPSADFCSEEEVSKGELYKKQYDYIVAVQVLEYVKDLGLFFQECKSLLNQKGKLLFTMDNRMGIRYFCGDRDPFTNRNFDGVENYRRVSALDIGKQQGRVWDKATVESFLSSAGFEVWQSFSVFPNIETPQHLYAQDYLPKEDLSMRYFPMYNYPDSVFLEEAYLYDGLIKNNMFHQMANGYLFECVLDTELVDIDHVTLSMDRGKEAAMATMIDRNDKVYKKALYKEGKNNLEQLQNNHIELENRGVSVIKGKLYDDTYIMPYVEAELANVYLQNLLRRDKEVFIQQVDKLREIIICSSEHVVPHLSEHEEREVIKDAPIQEGIWLKRAYFDLVPLNAFYMDGNYVFFDQEFYVENFPANAIIVRTLDIIYGGHTDLESILPIAYFWKRYEMENQVVYLRTLSFKFLEKLRHQDELRVYNKRHVINTEMIHSNRQRINYSSDEYQKLFINIFDGLDRYKVYVFGSGKFAQKFIELYGKQYPIEAILDNNSTKWGQEINGIKVCSPQILQNIDLQTCKVIICIKSFLGVMQQLRDSGVKNIGIYDTNTIYHQRERATNIRKDDSCEKKKYHKGYIAGVFDLYHVGHLNMFKRAKEQCEYLIVGVVSDEAVRKNKKVEPFIPFEERVELIRACKYVDEVVAIPENYNGTFDAYRLYQFDVQFSGDDYKDDSVWLMAKEYLQNHGSDLVFFPYTDQTSSTKIKALINKQLEEK